MNTKKIGNLTELQCITSFYELGYSVSIPYGDNSRYDFIADIDGKLIKVQVKTSHQTETDNDSSYTFCCRSSNRSSGGCINKKYTSDEIDYFCTFILGKCYLVPVSECSTSKTLRFGKPLNNNSKECYNLASDYDLEKQLNKLRGTKH